MIIRNSSNPGADFFRLSQSSTTCVTNLPSSPVAMFCNLPEILRLKRLKRFGIMHNCSSEMFSSSVDCAQANALSSGRPEAVLMF